MWLLTEVYSVYNVFCKYNYYYTVTWCDVDCSRRKMKKLRGTTAALTMNTPGHRRRRKNTGETLATFRLTGYINA